MRVTNAEGKGINFMPDEVKKAGPVPKASVEQLNALETKVNDGFSAIMNKLEGMQSPVPIAQVMKTEVDDAVMRMAPTEASADETPVPPAWKQLVTEILGSDFDAELVFPEAGGQIFRVIVPKDKSNASQMHWTMHKRDIRSRELGNTGAKGVKEWCLKVRLNLQKSGMKLPVYP